MKPSVMAVISGVSRANSCVGLVRIYSLVIEMVKTSMYRGRPLRHHAVQCMAAEQPYKMSAITAGQISGRYPATIRSPSACGRRCVGVSRWVGAYISKQRETYGHGRVGAAIGVDQFSADHGKDCKECAVVHSVSLVSVQVMVASKEVRERGAACSDRYTRYRRVAPRYQRAARCEVLAPRAMIDRLREDERMRACESFKHYVSSEPVDRGAPRHDCAAARGKTLL